MSTSVPPKPMRRDAVRNRERILDAAADLFARRGLAVTLNDVAHHAGVGVGTVYRHFPDRDELIRTLQADRVADMAAFGQMCLEDPDPWHGLIAAMTHSLELQAADRGLRELIHDSPAGLEGLVRAREQLVPIATALLRRAQAAGAVRADIHFSDVIVVQLMVVSVIDASREVDPELWRRSLALMLRGLAVDSDSVGGLPPASLTLEGVDRLLTASPPPRRPS